MINYLFHRYFNISNKFESNVNAKTFEKLFNSTAKNVLITKLNPNVANNVRIRYYLDFSEKLIEKLNEFPKEQRSNLYRISHLIKGDTFNIFKTFDGVKKELIYIKSLKKDFSLVKNEFYLPFILDDAHFTYISTLNGNEGYFLTWANTFNKNLKVKDFRYQFKILHSYIRNINLINGQEISKVKKKYSLLCNPKTEEFPYEVFGKFIPQIFDIDKEEFFFKLGLKMFENKEIEPQDLSFLKNQFYVLCLNKVLKEEGDYYKKFISKIIKAFNLSFKYTKSEKELYQAGRDLVFSEFIFKNIDNFIESFEYNQDFKKAKSCGNIFIEGYATIDTLGEGAYNNLYVIRNNLDSKLFALRVMKSYDESKISDEIKVFNKLYEKINGHPNIVQFHEAMNFDGNIALKYEKLEGNTLHDSIKHGLSENQIYNHIYGILNGLAHSHSRGVLHLDIKPENIWVGDDDVSKILDFGCSAVEDNKRSFIGSRFYLPPKLIVSGGRTAKASDDLFSVGLCLYEMVCGEALFGLNGQSLEGDKRTEYVNEIIRPLSDEQKLGEYIKEKVEDNVSSQNLRDLIYSYTGFEFKDANRALGSFRGSEEFFEYCALPMEKENYNLKKENEFLKLQLKEITLRNHNLS